VARISQSPNSRSFTEQRGYIRGWGASGEVTKARRADAEWRFVQTGEGRCRGLLAFGGKSACRRIANIDDEQRKALEGLLTSTNFVSVFRGALEQAKLRPA